MKSSKIKKLKDQVEYVLRTEHPTRNSDRFLVFRIYQLYYKQYSLCSQDGEAINGAWIRIDKAEAPDWPAIKRLRAFYQNTLKQYRPTRLDVYLKRMKGREDWEYILGYLKDELAVDDPQAELPMTG